MVLVINGNSRRSSTAAANSPCCSKAVTDRGGFFLGDDEHTGRMGTHTEDGKRRGRAPRPDTRKETASPLLTDGALD
jgi:hypothetical protein